MPASLSAIERYSADHLLEGAAHWSALHTAWTTHFGRVRHETEGLNWLGAGGEGAWRQSVRDEDTAHGAAMVARAAGSNAKSAAATLMFLKQTVLDHVQAARANGFRVNDDLSVQDTAKSYPSIAIAAARQHQAQLHATDIGCATQELLAHDAQIAAVLHSHGTALDAMQFCDGQPLGGSLRP